MKPGSHDAKTLTDEEAALLRDFLRREIQSRPEVGRNWRPGLRLADARIATLRGLLDRLSSTEVTTQ